MPRACLFLVGFSREHGFGIIDSKNLTNISAEVISPNGIGTVNREQLFAGQLFADN